MLGLLLAHAAGAQSPAAADAGGFDDSDVLVLQVRAGDQPLSDALTGYQAGDDVLLPLGELSRVLTLAITTAPSRGTAGGYILDEARAFNLDLTRGMVEFDGRSERVDPHHVDVRADDIYVASRLLARWLPVDLEVDMSTLALDVRPRERLPLQFRLERERTGATAAPRAVATERNYRLHRIPYRLASIPFIDQTFAVDFAAAPHRPRDLRGRYTAYATGDLLGMQAALYVNATTVGGASGLRVTLGRQDPDAGLLGPMRARTAMLGSIAMPGIANVSRSSALGEGVLVSNRPLAQPTRFGQHSLQGPLPPGWDVELYFNDVLVGFQTGGPDGQYHFPDQPLLLGPNDFRLVFHGPLGQVRVETQSFPFDQSIIRKGEFFYSLAAQRDRDGHARVMAQADAGLGEHMAVTAGVVRAPVGDAGTGFAYAGLLGHWRTVVANVDVVKAQDGGALAQLTARTRLGKWALSATHAGLRDFSSEWFLPSSDPVRALSSIRADGALMLPGARRLPAALEATHETRSSGRRSLDVTARLSTRMLGSAVTGQFHVRSTNGERLANATMQMSRRVGGFSLRSQVTYALAPQRGLGAVSLAADKRLGDRYLLTGSVSRLWESHTTIGSIGLTKSLGRFGLGVNATYSSDRHLTAGAQVFVGLGREPRRARWMPGALPVAGGGAVSALVFLDDDMDGLKDPDEQAIPGAAFTVDGGRSPVLTGADGIAYLERLPAQRHTDIAMVAGTLEDPQWQPVVDGVRLVPRAGVVAQLEFPVVMTSDVDGLIVARQGGVLLEISGMPVEVVDAEGRVVASGVSGADGYYVLTGVRPGSYQLRLPEASLQRLGLHTTRRYPFTVGRDGAYVSGMDIELQQRHD